ncbi:MAG: DNA-processing protein DprA [Patescibacteria group bacterium]|nr:DNA-processing protein DprA [Patescibacteria group bacterium]
MSGIQKLAPESYPALLREIPEPPATLYFRGTLPPPETKLLAVVGSRKMSHYGKDAVEHLIAGLAGYPVAIVSGLALGVDGAAHRAALSAGLPTIAVPGSGLSDDVLYPRAHVPLAHDILAAGGALMSEFEPDFRARPESFPQRNRLMAGMSHATLVIEAGLKSGTLITARLASDYGRELLVVPHSIFAEGGAGGHIFMKLGGAPARSSADILEALGIEPAEEKRVLSLTENEEKVLACLSEPLPRDELIRALGMSARDANVLLAAMELRGIIAESMGEIRMTI